MYHVLKFQWPTERCISVHIQYRYIYSMHPLCGELLPVRVTRGALVAHRYTYAPHRCRTSQFRRTFILLSVSLSNNLRDPVFDGVGLAGFKSRANASLLAWSALSLFVFHYFLFPLFLSLYRLVLSGRGLRTDRSSPGLTLPTFFNNNNNNVFHIIG